MDYKINNIREVKWNDNKLEFIADIPTGSCKVETYLTSNAQFNVMGDKGNRKATLNLELKVNEKEELFSFITI